MAPKNSDGDIVNNTEIRQVYSLEDVETAMGSVASLGSLAYAALKRKHPNCLIDVVSPTPSAGAAATGSIQVSGTITADYTGRITISGRVIDVPWLVGESAAQFHAKAVTYIGRYSRDIYCHASVGTGPDRILLSANAAGPAGNDIAVSFTLLDGAGGTIADVDAALTGGTTEPDFTTALATINGREYDFIGVCLSNADAASTSGNFSRLDTHVTGLDTGPQAKLQQGIAGHTGLRTAAMVSSAARNEQQLELINLQNAMALPCEVMGDEMGGRMQGVALKISANRIGEEMQVYGAEDPVANHPTTAQSDAALLAGVTVCGYLQNGTPYVMRPITTYTATATGAQVLPTDSNEIDAIYQYAKDLRAALPLEFAGVKVSEDVTEPEDELPEGVVELRDIKSFIITRTRDFWIPKGIINKKHFEEQVAGGTLVVALNATDETQVDIFIPAKPFKNLAKMGLYMAKDG
jgi:phage tail sheath gpL-like